MTPVLYYVYRLAALHKFPHVEDLLAQYENSNELDGWIQYFQQDDERLLNMMKAAFAGARPVTKVPQVPVKEKEEQGPVIDMTDTKNQESFLKFVMGAK